LYQWIQDDLFSDFVIMKLPAYQGEWGEGELLFPTRLSWKTLKELKKQQGNAHFSAQYMLDPIPEEDQIFRGPFKTYEETDLRGIDLKKFITIDPAISEDKQADYSAMTCVGVDKNNDWYILDIWRDRVQPKRLIDQVFYWNEKWKPISVGIETVAFQKALQYFVYDEMKRRNLIVPLRELGNTNRAKDERIRGLQPRYEMGSVFHPQKTAVPLVVDLEDELLRFPKGKNDDLVDSLASQLELCFPPRAKEQRTNVNRAVYPA
jgi:predicted phage terminase large subunit-like protein